MEGIHDYVNALEDAQKRSKRAGKPITEDTVFLVTKNTTLSTEISPWAYETWEELPKNEKNGPSWKNLYTVSNRKAKAKNQAVGGQD